jgi:hypothetical protein
MSGFYIIKPGIVGSLFSGLKAKFDNGTDLVLVTGGSVPNGQSEEVAFFWQIKPHIPFVGRSQSST